MRISELWFSCSHQKTHISRAYKFLIFFIQILTSRRDLCYKTGHSTPSSKSEWIDQTSFHNVKWLTLPLRDTDTAVDATVSLNYWYSCCGTDNFQIAKHWHQTNSYYIVWSSVTHRASKWCATINVWQSTHQPIRTPCCTDYISLNLT